MKVEEKNAKKFYTAKNDIVFKTIFINDNDYSLMNALLSEILGCEVKVIRYLKNELDIKDIDEREKRVDALIEADGKKIHLELNTDCSKAIRYRNYIYFEAFHSNETRKSKKYDNKTEYYHIDLTFGLKDGFFPIEIYGVNLENKPSYNVHYIENVKFYVVNMDMIKKFWYYKNRKEINRYKYLLMLDLSKEELKIYAQNKDALISDYVSKIMEVNDNFSFRNFISPAEDDRMLQEALKEEYFDDGVAEVAKNMLLDNEPIQKIIKYTGLSAEEIVKLQESKK
jgi:hypothetical protein